MDISAALGVCLSCSRCPGVSLALGDRNRTIRVLSNGEVQSVGAGATITIVVVVDVGSAFGVSLTSSGSPGIAFTFGDIGCVVRAVVNGEVQGVGAGAAITVVVVVDVGAAFGVSQSGTSCPGVVLAFGDGGHVVRTVVNGEVQCVGAGTTIAVVVVVDVGSALGVGQTRSRCPGVGFAFGDGGHIVRSVMDCQMQGIST